MPVTPVSIPRKNLLVRRDEIGRGRRSSPTTNQGSGAIMLPMQQISTARVPQRDGKLFLTDSGLETTLIFQEGWDLPNFEAFTLLARGRGQAALRRYYERHA